MIQIESFQTRRQNHNFCNSSVIMYNSLNQYTRSLLWWVCPHISHKLWSVQYTSWKKGYYPFICVLGLLTYSEIPCTYQNCEDSCFDISLFIHLMTQYKGLCLLVRKYTFLMSFQQTAFVWTNVTAKWIAIRHTLKVLGSHVSRDTNYTD
jgi:hypothetical protein